MSFIDFDRIMAKLDAGEKKSFQEYFIKQNREKGLLRTVFNNIRDGIIVIDRRFNVRYRNRAAAELIGIPDDTSKYNITRFLRDIEWKKIFGMKEYEWYKSSRREIEVFYPIHRYLLFYMLPHESEKGTAIIILQDITESRRSTMKQMESEKMEIVSILAAGVAHEIGNPLNSLSLNLQLLSRLLAKDTRKPGKNAEKALELLKTAGIEVNRLDMIIKEFLQAVRPVPLDIRKVNLEETIGEVLEFLKQELSDRLILVKCMWARNIPLVNGDYNQLKQAFFNLIRNAVQAMPGGGELKITCSMEDENIKISFSDEGAGISPEDIGRIFDPYFTTKKEGNGLGLVIVERIVREHGARLLVESTEKKGTTFTVEFPTGKKRVKLLSSVEEPENKGGVKLEQ